jgi:hypothetical protein
MRVVSDTFLYCRPARIDFYSCTIVGRVCEQSLRRQGNSLIFEDHEMYICSDHHRAHRPVYRNDHDELITELSPLSDPVDLPI